MFDSLLNVHTLRCFTMKQKVKLGKLPKFEILERPFLRIRMRTEFWTAKARAISQSDSRV